MTTRERLHELIDRLPEDSLGVAERALAGIASPSELPSLKQRLERAPVDDEPLTAEDIEAIDRGLRSMREGRGVSQQEVKRRLAEL